MANSLSCSEHCLDFVVHFKQLSTSSFTTYVQVPEQLVMCVMLCTQICHITNMKYCHVTVFVRGSFYVVHQLCTTARRLTSMLISTLCAAHERGKFLYKFYCTASTQTVIAKMSGQNSKGNVCLKSSKQNLSSKTSRQNVHHPIVFQLLTQHVWHNLSAKMIHGATQAQLIKKYGQYKAHKHKQLTRLTIPSYRYKKYTDVQVFP